MKEITIEDINALRNLLISHNEASRLVIHASSDRYGFILENNVRDAKDANKRLVVWRGLYGSYEHYCMERNEFYSKFKEAFDDNVGIEALIKYMYKK